MPMNLQREAVEAIDKRRDVSGDSGNIFLFHRKVSFSHISMGMEQMTVVCALLHDESGLKKYCCIN